MEITGTPKLVYFTVFFVFFSLYIFNTKLQGLVLISEG